MFQTFAAPSDAAALRGEALMIPIAHGEGRYFADAETLKSLEDQEQIIFKYCDDKGIVGNENPNGTSNHIAGICNEGRNVFGMMPHPERACSSILGNTDGRKIFESLIQ